VLTPLPRPSIDTGMGLERVRPCCKASLFEYETDLIRPIIDQAPGAVPRRVLARHALAASIPRCALWRTTRARGGVLIPRRGAAFERRRGYVLRKIMAGGP